MLLNTALHESLGRENRLELDAVDFKILKVLQANARASLKSLAMSSGVSVPTARFRLRRLRQLGVIKRFVTSIDAAKLAGGLSAFILLKARLPDVQEVVKSLGSFEEVSEAYLTTGQFDVVLRIDVSDMKAFEDFVIQKLSRIPGVETYQSSFVVEPLKEQYGPSLRPGFGVRIKCEYCGKIIAGDFVRRLVDSTEHYFCCETCAAASLPAPKPTVD